jgi:hypothetical protein
MQCVAMNFSYNFTWPLGTILCDTVTGFCGMALDW